MKNIKSAKTGIAIIIVGILAITGFIALKGLIKPKEKSIVALKTNKTKSLPKKTKFVPTAHTIIPIDPLDDTKVPGVPLDEALEKVGRGTSLPDASVVGKTVKVVLNETAYYDTGKWGMRVLYDSGIKLGIAPTQEDFQEALQRKSAPKLAPYTDGRKNSYEERQVAGRQTLVRSSGIQIVNNSGAKHKVFPSVIWNMNGMKYTLSTGSDEVSVDDLIKAAESIR